jgi:hypothetical protein
LILLFNLGHKRRFGPSTPLTPSQLRMTRIFLWSIAAIVQLIGAVLLVRVESWRDGSLVTSGKVVDHQVHSGNKGGKTYSEVVEFNIADGRVIRFDDPSSSPQPFAKGDIVAVRYQPLDPSDASIDEWHRIWGAPIALLSTGVMFFVVGSFARAPKSPATDVPETSGVA